jgi:hypothetical protein
MPDDHVSGAQDQPTNSQIQFSYRIYIIESPSAIDFLRDRQEGQALLSALQLAQINASRHVVVDRDTLRTCFGEIFAQHRLDGGPTFVIPVIHLSSHGNATGIALTSEKTPISWKELGELFKNSNKSVDGFLWLSMSTCEGFNASQMAFDLQSRPFYALVGPTTKVTWTDSLTAYVTFYHHLNNKKSTIANAIIAMNHAAGLPPGTFVSATSEGLQQAYRNYLVAQLTGHASPNTSPSSK